MLREVLRAYGIEGLRPRRVGAGNNNEHWFAGRHVLRRYRDGRQPDTVVYEHTILDHLQALGWPVAVPLAARDGARILNLGDQLYALFPRLPGRRGIPDRPREPRELGRMLARLHRDLATCGFDRPAPHFTAILDLTTTTWGTGTHTIDELIEGMAVDAPEYAASCLRLLAEVRRAVADVDLHGMQRTLVHGDWHAGNLLFRHSEVSGVLDFDFAHPDLRVADLAASAMVVDTDSAVELIEGYQEVSALPSEELGLLNLHEQARLLGAVAATLSIRARNGRAGNSLPVLAEMLHRLEHRWPELRRRIGLS